MIMIDAEAANDPDELQLGQARCRSLIAGLPSEWHGWPLGISVGFVMTPGTCVSQRLFEEYRVDSMERAIGVVLAERNWDLFLGYRFYGLGFYPAFQYFAAWPLNRRGKDEPTDVMVASRWLTRYLERGIRNRESIGGAAPWERVPDDTVFEIWREPVNVYGSRTVLMLRAGGRTMADAKSNWVRCAKAIRRASKPI